MHQQTRGKKRSRTTQEKHSTTKTQAALAACTFESLESRQLMSATALAAPANLAAAVKGPTSIQLSWTGRDTTAQGYYLLRSSDGANFSQFARVTNYRTASFTDTTVAPHTQYTYEVQAFNGTKTSPRSTAASATTYLLAPRSLTATSLGTHTIGLNWTDSDSTATGYRIFRTDTTSFFFSLTTVTDPAATSFTDTSVPSGHTYYYEVQALSGANSSLVSNVATATSALAAPSGLSASAVYSNAVQLSWTDNDYSAAGYYVLRSNDGTTFSQVAKLTGMFANGFLDKSALPNHTYFYEVKAYDSWTTSPVSGAASTTTPMATPGSVVAAAQSPTSVQLTWADSDASAAGYNILRAPDGGSFVQIAQITGGSTHSWMDLGLSSNTAYHYEVQAFTGGTTSAISSAASATTPLFAVTGLSASAPTTTSIQLNWTDNDPAATGYIVYRALSTSATFSVLTRLTDSAANSYTDLTVGSGSSFKYEVQAINSINSSAIAGPVSVTTSMAAPSDLHASQSGASVALSWIDHDSSAAGYYVMRSTDGGATFSKLATISGASAASFSDSTVSSAHSYSYEIEAFNATTTSAMSNVASVTTTMNAPASLIASASGTYISLSWTSKDASATGFKVLRSTDGSTFFPIATVSPITTTSYTDTSVSAGQSYYYEVQAFNSTMASAPSNVVNITAPTPLNPTPVNPTVGTVTFATRYNNELVITSSSDDTISLSQSGSTLTITADGQVFTQSVPAAGVFIYTRGGTDSISLDSTVAVRTTIESIDGTSTSINSAGTNVSVWMDSTDAFLGSGVVHSVASFAGGVSKALGAAMANPTDSGTTFKPTGHSLFGAAPIADDINQGSVGDCYYLSSLAAFAQVKPSVVQEAAVDMGDGTYVVRYFSIYSVPTYVRVSNDLPSGYFNGYAYAHPGADGDIWAPIMEKAYAYYRTGANTYASLNSGWMGSVYTNLGVVNNTIFLGNYSTESTFYNMVSSALANGQAVTLGTTTAPNLVSNHAYTLIRVYTDSTGTHYVVRNPWGSSGDSLENSQGYATLTWSQIKANFYDGSVAA